VVEVLIGGSQTGDGACSNAGNGNAFAVPVDCGFVQFDICGSTDTDGDFNVNVVGNSEPDAGPLGGVFCTTPDCVASAQSTLGACALNLGDNCAVPVPFSAATDGRDHWLSAGEPHCADCHAAPYVEQSGNVNAFPPFNYPRKSSLMRYSRGHQDITCQGCHESIHGLYPVTPLIDTTSYAQAASLNADNTHGPLKCGTCHTVDTATGIPLWMGFGSHDIPYNGAGPVELKDGVLDRNSYEEMVGWMHTYTEEANPLESTCLACHAPKGTEWAMLTSDTTTWYRHKKPANDGDFTPKFTINKIDRGAMDAAEKAKTAGDPAGPCPTVEGGCVFGDPDPDDDGDTVWNGGDVDNPGEDPSVTVCLGCHTPTGKNNNIEGKLDTVPGCVGDTGIIQTWKTHLAQGRVSEKVWTAVSEHVIGSTCGW
jgi:mono/diheme cytochrome c family protein